jgi:hypothetical protein
MEITAKSVNGSTLLIKARCQLQKRIATTQNDYFYPAKAFFSQAFKPMSLAPRIKIPIASQTRPYDLFAAFAFVMPWVLLLLAGNDFYIRIHDTLEGELGWFALLKQHYNPFSVNGLTEVYGSVQGLPAGALPSPFSPIYLLFHFFDLPLAYHLLRALVQLLAFAGMYSLLGKLNHSLNWRFPLAVLFSLLPFYPTFGISVAGLPAVLSAGFSLRSNWKSGGAWIWLLLFGLFSSPVWGWPPAMLLLCFTAFFGLNRQFRFSFAPIFGALFISILFLLVHFPLWQLLFSAQSPEMHRTVYLPPDVSLLSLLTDTLSLLLVGHYHAGMFYALPAWGMLFFLGKADKRLQFLGASVLALVFLHSIFPLAGHLIPAINPLRTLRLITLLPMLWLLIFYFSANHLPAKLFGKILAIQLLLGILTHDENWHNLRHIVAKPRFPSYNEYLGEDLFRQFKSEFPSASTRVACLGFPPSLAWFQHIATIDGLHALYPLAYKEKFRKFIAPELEKSESLQTYFDHWGNRCFTFSAALGHSHNSIVPELQQDIESLHINLNVSAFSELGGTHLLSSLPLELNPEWTHASTYASPKHDWLLYVYIPLNHEIRLNE